MKRESHPLRYLKDHLAHHQKRTTLKRCSSVGQPASRRKTRRFGLEQLEARRVLAAALLNSTSLAEGESSEPQVFYFSPSVPGYVKNSNQSKLYVDDSDIVKLTVMNNHQWHTNRTSMAATSA